MDRRPLEKDVLRTRGAAVTAVFLVSGPLFFGLWIYIAKIDISSNPPSRVWAVPIAATAFCSLLMLILPARLVRFIGKAIGWIPYV